MMAGGLLEPSPMILGLDASGQVEAWSRATKKAT